MEPRRTIGLRVITILLELFLAVTAFIGAAIQLPARIEPPPPPAAGTPRARQAGA